MSAEPIVLCWVFESEEMQIAGYKAAMGHIRSQDDARKVGLYRSRTVEPRPRHILTLVTLDEPTAARTREALGTPSDFPREWLEPFVTRFRSFMQTLAVRPRDADGRVEQEGHYGDGQYEITREGGLKLRDDPA